MDVMIERTDGQSFTLADYGVTARDFVVSSIPIIPRYGTSDGRHGTIDYGATYGTRTISVPFYYKSDDMLDYATKRDTLFGIIGGLQSFYIREMRRDVYQTGDNVTVNDRKYKVRLVNDFAIEQSFKYGFGELVFETTELPFGESDVISQTFTLPEFRLVNEGNVEIHPFEQQLKITISDSTRNIGHFEMRNITNGSSIRINDNIATQDIVIDGARITSNGLDIIRKTDKGVITLSPGWNDFEIVGTFDAKIKFEYPHYYL